MYVLFNRSLLFLIYLKFWWKYQFTLQLQSTNNVGALTYEISLSMANNEPLIR
jgi:hypothetical protein